MDDDARPPRRRRWVRWALGLLGVSLLSPLALVGAASFYLRHVPYTIPAEDRPPAQAGEPQTGGLTLKYLGISGYEVSDGQTVILLDPVFTRPTITGLISGPLAPNDALLDQHLPPQVDFVLVNHGHYDHALDAPRIAARTGAKVVGSRSAINLCRSRGLPEEQLIEVAGGEHLSLGTFEVDVGAVPHSPVLGVQNPMAGVIPADAGPLWYWQYRQDGCRIYRLQAGGTSLWFHPTSMYAEGELHGLQADALIMGVSGAPPTQQVISGVVAEARPQVFLPTHYDNFFQPLAKGLALLPSADLAEVRQLVVESDPNLPYWVLDYGQTVHLPPRPAEPR